MGQEQPASNELSLQGTSLFRSVNGRRRRALRVQMPVPFCGPALWHVEGRDGALDGESEAIDGQLMAYSPHGSSAQMDPDAVEARVSCADGSWTGRAAVSPTRLWTIYIAQDKHLDYGWIHPVERVAERMNVLTDYYLDAAEEIGLHWNLDTSIWVEEFLRARPTQRSERLLSSLRAGQFEVAALWLVPFPGTLGTEEVLQSLSYARHLQDTYAIPVHTASLQEVPTLPWGYATILAGAGIPYPVTGAYHLRNPHLGERDPLPLVAWEGPDGSRVLLRWPPYGDTSSWGGYAEAYRLWRASSDGERAQFIEETIARYEQFERYPWNSILLAGVGHDEYPQTTAVSDFIRSYNVQGWEYPRLVDATWGQFWQDIEGQTATDGIQIPVVKGDWGTSWEEWPAQLARLNTAYRRARETVITAQALTALVYRLDPATHRQRTDALALAWRGLLQFSDHNIGGITEELGEDMHDRKATYAPTAAREGARALEGGLAAIAANVPRDDAGRRLLVANPDSWQHNGLVEMVVPEAGPYDVTDVASDRPVGCQVETRGRWPEHYLSFVAPDVPAFGYRCFSVRPASSSAAAPEAGLAGPVMENVYFKLTIDPETGGLRSLWERATDRELVSTTGGWALNQYLHFSEGALYRPRLEALERPSPAKVGSQGNPNGIGASLVATISCLRARLRTTYRLYDSIPRLDIVNELIKEPSAELQCSWFLFPFKVAAPLYNYDGPAAILRAGLQAEGGDLLPGAGRTCVAVQSFLAVTDGGLTTILATPDANLFQFGEGVLKDPLSDSDPRQPLALSLVMHNFTRNDAAIAQGGQAHQEFRYSISVAGRAFSGSRAVRFARQAAGLLPATWVTGNRGAGLPAGEHSFLSIAPENVVATGLKAAEDGHGWVLRLWECDGHDTEAEIQLGEMGATQAWQCDLLERTGEALPIDGGTVRLMIPARGLKALRFEV